MPIEKQYSDDIPAEEINSLPVVAFKGPIIQVTTKAALDDAMATLKNEPCIGFDTETRPSFTKGKTYPLSLIQLATPSMAYIIKVKDAGLTDSFISLMESPVEKIGIGLKDDMQKIQSIKKFKPASLVDLSVIAKEKGYIKTNLRILCARYLNQRLVKSAQKTNWARTVLTETQLRYAATDAWVCLILRPFLENDRGVVDTNPN